MLAALTRRVSELEERLATTRADLRAERSRLASYAESEGSLNEAAAESYRKADEILQRARGSADNTLVAAVDERRTLLNDVARLREEREDLHDEIASLRSGGHASPQATQSKSPPALDLQTAIATEMRTLLVELLADFRARSAAPSPVVEAVAPTAEVANDEVVTAAALEHIDEPASLVPGEPVIDEYVEDLRGSRQSA